VAKQLLLSRARGRRSVAEKEPTWAITKKLFFDPEKNTLFSQILKTGKKCSFQPMKPGELSIPYFLIVSEFRSKTGSKKYRVKPTVDYKFRKVSDTVGEPE